MSENKKLLEELDQVLEVIKKIEDEHGLFRLGCFIKPSGLFKALYEGDVFVKAEGFARAKSFVGGEMNRRVSILMRDGLIYAPRPGFFKRTTWADEQCTWTCPELGCGERCGGRQGHDSEHECPTHHRAISWKTLGSKILAVAKQGGNAKEWTCYIAPVPGDRHEDEWQAVIDYGHKLSYHIAKVLFPSFARRYRYV